MGDTRPMPAAMHGAIPKSITDWAKDETRDLTTDDAGWFAMAVAKPETNVIGDLANSLGHIANDWELATWFTLGSFWMRHQCVYEFDDGLTRELELSNPPSHIPSEILTRLPYGVVWVQQFPGVGFYASVVGVPSRDVGVPSGRRDLMIVQVAIGTKPSIVAISLPLDETLESAVGEAYDSASGQDIKRVGVMVSMLLYLCSEEPDITHRPSPMNQARLRRGKSPYHPTIHHVGYRIGAAFRKAKAEREASQGSGGHGASPAPHMRRAHWHTYWVGKENTPQRRQVVKWLPPIPVNVKSDDDIIPTIHKVKR